MLSENMTDETSWEKGLTQQPVLECLLISRIIVQPSRENRRPREDYEYAVHINQR